MSRFIHYYAKCRVLYIIMLSVIMLNVVMLSVVMLSVTILSVIILSVVMLNVVVPMSFGSQARVYCVCRENVFWPNCFRQRGAQQFFRGRNGKEIATDLISFYG
jgi:hypothetical protein